jgi:hypothetical protein
MIFSFFHVAAAFLLPFFAAEKRKKEPRRKNHEKKELILTPVSVIQYRTVGNGYFALSYGFSVKQALNVVFYFFNSILGVPGSFEHYNIFRCIDPVAFGFSI